MNSDPKNILPFHYRGNSTGCLLIHGFTGSPGEMLPLGQRLHEEGYTVKGVLLPGHGRTPGEMKETGWRDWYDEVRGTYLGLRETCGRVYCIGLSMGGTLALKLAAEYPEIAGVVSVCAPVFVADKNAYGITEEDVRKIGFIEKNMENKKDYDSFWYERTPLTSLVSLMKGLEKFKSEISSVVSPLLVVQACRDRSVDPASAGYIYDNAFSPFKEKLYLEKSGHIATLDCEKEFLEEKVLDFIGRLEKSRPEKIMSFTSGPDNRFGLHLLHRHEGERTLIDFFPEERHVGYPGIMHGGLIFSVFDDLAYWTVLREGWYAFTARSDIRFRKNVPVGQVVHFEAERPEMRKQLADVTARAFLDDGTVVAEFKGRFMLVQEADEE